MSGSTADTQDDPFSTWFNMDIDDFGVPAPSPPRMSPIRSSHSLPTVSPAYLSHSPSLQGGDSLPAAPVPLRMSPIRSSHSLPMISPAYLSHSPSLQGGDSLPAAPVPPSSVGSSASLRHGMRGTTPFAFRGGALCIVPPRPHSHTENTISLNSDNEEEHPARAGPSTHYRAAPGPSMAQESDSSHRSSSARISRSYFSPIPSESSDQQSRRIVSTPPTSAIEPSADTSGSRRSTTKRARTPAARTPAASAVADTFIMQADELIKRGTTIADQQRREKVHRRETHYNDKAAEREHQERMAQLNADQIKRTQDFEMKMAQLKLQQLDRELELAKVQSGHPGADVSSSSST